MGKSQTVSKQKFARTICLSSKADTDTETQHITSAVWAGLFWIKLPHLLCGLGGLTTRYINIFRALQTCHSAIQQQLEKNID